MTSGGDRGSRKALRALLSFSLLMFASGNCQNYDPNNLPEWIHLVDVRVGTGYVKEFGVFLRPLHFVVPANPDSKRDAKFTYGSSSSTAFADKLEKTCGSDGTVDTYRISNLKFFDVQPFCKKGSTDYWMIATFDETTKAIRFQRTVCKKKADGTHTCTAYDATNKQLADARNGSPVFFCGSPCTFKGFTKTTLLKAHSMTAKIENKFANDDIGNCKLAP